MASAKIKILHVDDKPDLLDLTATFLEREDDRFSVQTATSASQGLELLADTDVDCIVSDYQMPGLNGIEFLERLREEYPDLPFILYTGKGSEEVASETLSAGATDYLQKGSGTDQYELLANRIQNAVEQSRAQQRALELDRIRSLIADINQALVRADSRSEAETRVCALISDSEPYQMAWVGEVDPETDRVEPREWGGIEQNYLDEITVTADDTPTGRGPVGRAIENRRIAVAQNIQEDPMFEPWREAALERGYRAVAAVPLEYDDTLYGTLAVYAGRPDPFDVDELGLLAELGGDLGHAIHSFEVHREREKIRHRFLALTENSGLGVLTIDEESTIRYANGAVREIIGYEPDDLIGQSLSTIIPDRYHADHHQGFADYLTEGTKQVDWGWVEVAGLHSEGHEVSLGISFGEATIDGNPRITGILRDITERKERQRNLERFKKAVEHAGHAVYITDSDGTIEYVNPAFETITGYSAAEAIGRNPRILNSGEMSEAYFEELWETLLDGTVWEEEVINRRQDGEQYHAHQTIAPIVDEDDIDEFVAIQTDISEQKEREEALESSRDTYQDLFDGIEDAVFVHEPTGEFIAVNEAACDRLGYTEDELLELSPEDIDAPEYAEHAPDKVSAMEDEKSLTFETVHVTKSGERIPVEIAASSTQYFGKDAILSVARDISERKEREKTLERRTQAIEEAPVGISISDPEKPDNPLIYVNDAFTEITGYSREDILGENCRVLQGERTGPDAVARIREAIEANEPVSLDLRNYRKDGTEFWNHVEIAPVTNDAGDVINYVGYQRDITERKQRELNLAHQNEQLDQFASVVSHDLRNPLTIAQSRLELAQDECDSDHLDDVTEAHKRMSTLVEDLLTLAQTGSQLSETSPVELAPLVESCWRGVATGDSTIVSEADQTIRADRTRVQQLLENLFRNAIDHGGEEVTVTVGDLDDRNGFFVADDGAGIPADERDKVVEPGYSTSDDGTGLGLSIVHEIAEAHGWELILTDGETSGARFEISGVETANE